MSRRIDRRSAGVVAEHCDEHGSRLVEKHCDEHGSRLVAAESRRARLCTWVTLAMLAFPLCGFAQRFQVSTNALDWACLGTINGQFDVAVDRHWSVGIAGKYNPFRFGSETAQFALKQRNVSLAARWWPWYVYSGWWVCGRAQWQEYNEGGLISARTEEGQRYGGGLSAGYAHMISPHLNMEFGLGLWAGVKRYTLYSCPTCGEKLDSGQKMFVLPSDFVISFSYVF